MTMHITGTGAVTIRDPIKIPPMLLRDTMPSIFAVHGRRDMSESYRYIPTIEVVEALEKIGFNMVAAKQAGTRKGSDIERTVRRQYVRHELRFRQADQKPIVGGVVREVMLTNSHDGTSAYDMGAGLFRFVCANGMVVPAGADMRYKVHHRGPNVIADILENALAIAKTGGVIAERIEAMQGRVLSTEERCILANRALNVRWPDGAPIQEPALLRSRRFDDQGTDLWKTLNVIQENIERGGVIYETKRGQKTIQLKTRPVNEIRTSQLINEALWKHAEEFLS
jgi:hypothetical protein